MVIQKRGQFLRLRAGSRIMATISSRRAWSTVEDAKRAFKEIVLPRRDAKSWD
jgi:hypothetical protein